MALLATNLLRFSKGGLAKTPRKVTVMAGRRSGTHDNRIQTLRSHFTPSKSFSRALLAEKRRAYTTSSPSSPLDSTTPAAKDPGPASTEGVFQLGTVEADSHSRMLTLIFTCNICQTRAARQFSHHSYNKGVVIIQCPGCEKYHLIADHLGWFQEGKNIEEFMAKKGDTVRKITDANDITPEIQEFVDEAARERAASAARRKEYVERREKERAELAQAQAERKAEEAAEYFDDTLKPR